MFEKKNNWKKIAKKKLEKDNLKKIFKKTTNFWKKNCMSNLHVTKISQKTKKKINWLCIKKNALL